MNDLSTIEKMNGQPEYDTPSELVIDEADCLEQRPEGATASVLSLHQPVEAPGKTGDYRLHILSPRNKATRDAHGDNLVVEIKESERPLLTIVNVEFAPGIFGVAVYDGDGEETLRAYYDKDGDLNVDIAVTAAQDAVNAAMSDITTIANGRSL